MTTRPAWPLKGHHYARRAAADSSHPNVICTRSQCTDVEKYFAFRRRSHSAGADARIHSRTDHCSSSSRARSSAGRVIPTTPLTYRAPALDAAAAVEHLSTALRFETISYDDRTDAPDIRALSRVARRNVSALSRERATHGGGRRHARVRVDGPRSLAAAHRDDGASGRRARAAAAAVDASSLLGRRSPTVTSGDAERSTTRARSLQSWKRRSRWSLQVTCPSAASSSYSATMRNPAAPALAPPRSCSPSRGIRAAFVLDEGGLSLSDAPVTNATDDAHRHRGEGLPEPAAGGQSRRRPFERAR